MSLFHTLDFWSTRCGEDETFGFDSMVIADLNESGNDFIIVGSFSGMLRVYQLSNDDADCSFKPSNLLLEKQLSSPIIQVFAGRLVSGTRALHIGVALPTCINVYNLLSIPGSTDHGNQFDLKLMFEHQLQHINYVVVHGPFGGVNGRDFIAAVSLDGIITFFEQEMFVSKTQLPSFLLPSAIVYVEETDMFVMLSADWCIEGYRYQDLVSAKKKKVVANWSHNLGESVQSIKPIKHHLQKEAFIAILSERNLTCLGANGNLQFSKRLQYSPLLFYCYLNESNNNLMTLIVSDESVLYIYERKTLLWSAKLPFLPVCISRGNTLVNGSLVLLSDHGDLQCCYLGTKPSLFVAPPLENSVVSFKNMNTRLETLQEEIKSFKENNDDLLSSRIIEHELSSTVKMQSLDKSFNELKIIINLIPSCPLSYVNVSFEVASSFNLQPPNFAFPTLCETTELSAVLHVSPFVDVVPSSLDLKVIICYSREDVVRVIQQHKTISPKFVLMSCSVPDEKCIYKINIESNQVPQTLTTVFQDFLDDSWMESSCSDEFAGFCLRYNPEKFCAISLTKPNPGYDLVSNSFPLIRLILSVIIWKYQNMKFTPEKSIGEYSFKCKSLPRDKLIECINQRIRTRNEIRDLQLLLERLSTQFRLIQRRVLIKLKDKISCDINALQILYQNTHEKLIETIHQVEDKQRELVLHSCELQSVMDLILDLILMNDSVSSEKVKKLRNAVHFVEMNSNTQDWEECTVANITYLLHTVLATAENDQYQSFLSSEESVEDPITLQNLIITAFERISDQFKISNKLKKSRGVAPILEADENDESFSFGNQILPSGRERLLSKRLSFDVITNSMDETTDDV